MKTWLMRSPQLHFVILLAALTCAALTCAMVHTCARSDDSSLEVPSLDLLADLDAGSAVTAPPILVRSGDGATLVAASSEGRIIAWSVPGFAEIWRIETGSSFEAAPIAIGQRLFAASLEGDVFVLDLSTGKTISRAGGLGQIKGGLSADSGGHALYAGSYDNHLYKLSTKDLSVVWRYAVGNFINGRPRVLSGGGVAFGSCDGFFYVVDGDSGTLTARVRAESYIPSTPAIGKGDVAYFAGYGGDLTAWSAKNGVLWVATPDGCSNVTAPVAYADGRVFIADQRGSVLAFGSDKGDALWRFEAGTGVEFDMLSIKGTLILASAGGALIMLDQQNGDETYSIPIGGVPSLGPAWLDPWLAVGTSTGRVLLYKIATIKGKK